ncbi:MAG: hypothetical protein PHD02_04825 [Bacilli bacterium]|nr:hypothetical protein [Bacilli bacterium]
MYEKRDAFTLRDVIFNLLFIILFVFILLWLFPSKSFLNNTQKGENSHIFNENIETMKEAAISYFTTPRLPSKVGDSVDLTLRQMIDKKLILPLVDGNGNTCDEGMSYVELTKEDDEYVLKVSLTCSDNDDYILVHLGCYDYCEGDVCEKQEDIYQYEYILITSCELTDFGAWSNWQTSYVQATNNRKVETKVDKTSTNATLNKSCASGFVYNASTGLCYKATSTSDTKDAIKTVTCPTNYTYNETSNVCEINSYLKEKEPDEYTSCIEGYTYNSTNNSCEKQTDLLTSYEKYCTKGTLSADKTKCTYSYTTTDTVDRTLLCSSKWVWNGFTYDRVTTCYHQCPGGYTISGSVCVATVTKYATITSSTRATGTYCPSGTTQSGSFCISTEPVKATYSCSKYGDDYELVKLDDDTYTCKIKSNLETKEANISYSCSTYGADYALNETKCTKIVSGSETANPIKTYSCPTGYTLNGTTCTKNVIYYRFTDRSCVGGTSNYKWSLSDHDESLLNQGYILTGSKKLVEE